MSGSLAACLLAAVVAGVLGLLAFRVGRARGARVLEAVGLYCLVMASVSAAVGAALLVGQRP